jgi:hypothetical protein
MRTKSVESSVILYRSGTLTLSQAARHAGCSDEEMAAAVEIHPQRSGAAATGRSTDAVYSTD